MYTDQILMLLGWLLRLAIACCAGKQQPQSTDFALKSHCWLMAASMGRHNHHGGAMYLLSSWLCSVCMLPPSLSLKLKGAYASICILTFQSVDRCDKWLILSHQFLPFWCMAASNVRHLALCCFVYATQVSWQICLPKCCTPELGVFSHDAPSIINFL